MTFEFVLTYFLIDNNQINKIILSRKNSEIKNLKILSLTNTYFKKKNMFRQKQRLVITINSFWQFYRLSATLSAPRHWHRNRAVNLFLAFDALRNSWSFRQSTPFSAMCDTDENSDISSTEAINNEFTLSLFSAIGIELVVCSLSYECASKYPILLKRTNGCCWNAN